MTQRKQNIKIINYTISIMISDTDNQTTIISEATYQLKQIDHVFHTMKQFSISFNSHVVILDRLVNSLLETYEECSTFEQNTQNETATKHRLTFQGPSGFAFRQNSFSKQNNTHDAFKEKTFDENISDLNESNKNYTGDNANLKNSKESLVAEYNTSRNIFRNNQSHNNTTVNDIEVQSPPGEQFEPSFKIPTITPKSLDNGMTFEVIKDQNKLFNQMVVSGEESSKVIKMLLEQIAVQRKNHNSNDSFKDKYDKLRVKYDKLKEENKEIGNERTELKFIASILKNNNEETLKINEKMKSSFLMNNLEKSTEIANTESYKRKIESQTLKIQKLVDDRDHLSSLLDSTNKKLFSLEQDIRSMRNEFIDLYKSIYENMRSPASIRSIKSADSNELGSGTLPYNKEMHYDEAYSQRNFNKAKTWGDDVRCRETSLGVGTHRLRESVNGPSGIDNAVSWHVMQDKGFEYSPIGSHRETVNIPSQTTAKHNSLELESDLYNDDNLHNDKMFDINDNGLYMNDKKQDDLRTRELIDLYLLEDESEKYTKKISLAEKPEYKKSNSFLRHQNKDSSVKVKENDTNNKNDQKTRNNVPEVVLSPAERENIINIFKNQELEQELRESSDEDDKEFEDVRLNYMETLNLQKMGFENSSKKSESYSLVQFEQSHRNSLDSKAVAFSKYDFDTEKKGDDTHNHFTQVPNLIQDDNKHNGRLRFERGSRRNSSLEHLGYPVNGETSKFYTFSNNPNNEEIK